MKIPSNNVNESIVYFDSDFYETIKQLKKCNNKGKAYAHSMINLDEINNIYF